LIRSVAVTASCAARTEPDWSHIHAELKGRGVTLALLWQEYRAEHAQGYAYSWFCERHSDWRKRISATMRQTHLAGEKLFVDWAGDTMPVFDPTTGEEHRVPIFVAALGASNYTYAEARWTETLPDWIGAHVEGARARQSEGWHHEAIALRAWHQPDVPGPRRPLRLRCAPRSRDEAARQGEGRGRGPDRPTLRTGEAAPSPLLLTSRVERGNPTIADAILDRLVHKAHRLTLKGESMRKMAASRVELAAGSGNLVDVYGARRRVHNEVQVCTASG
jgi:hypothetical protein